LTQQSEIQQEIEKEKQMLSEQLSVEKETPNNRFLVMDFWEFAIVSTLMAVFFPWSLLYCLLVYGMQDTKFIVIALAHDWIKTILAILSVLLPIVMLIGWLIFSKYGK
jgi:hypothetical protein